MSPRPAQLNSRKPQSSPSSRHPTPAFGLHLWREQWAGEEGGGEQGVRLKMPKQGWGGTLQLTVAR